MNSRNFKNLAIATMIGFSMIVGGCGGDGRTRHPREASTNLPPVQAQLNLGMPFDADGNGYPDTMQALVYLFPDSRYSAIPVRAVGTFDFLMHSESGELMAQWVFPPEIVEQAARNLPAGPGYSMYLRLAPGKDVMAPNAADIRVRFINEAGEQIRSTGRATVRLGG